jgi:hypothetical protein
MVNVHTKSYGVIFQKIGVSIIQAVCTGLSVGKKPGKDPRQSTTGLRKLCYRVKSSSRVEFSWHGNVSDVGPTTRLLQENGSH